MKLAPLWTSTGREFPSPVHSCELMSHLPQTDDFFPIFESNGHLFGRQQIVSFPLLSVRASSGCTCETDFLFVFRMKINHLGVSTGREFTLSVHVVRAQVALV